VLNKNYNEEKKMEKLYRWQLKDIIMVAILSLFFAVVYLGALHLALIAGAALTPFGLQPFAIEVAFGVWFMAATLAAYIMQKPGVAFVTEVLAAILEVLMGNLTGPLVIVSGIVQGLGAEAVFAAFRYRRFDMKSMCLAAFGCCVFSFIWGFFRSGFLLLSPGLLVCMFLVRTVSSLLFAGVLMKLCGDRLAKSGVLKAYPLGKK
jgi:energy-coupling factor transport system substrate-specific component